MPKRDAEGKWVKGSSGNPDGRPKRDYSEVQALAREYTDDAIRTLVEICNDPDAAVNSRVAAANSLLDRGWGRPPQSVDVTSDGGPLDVTIRLREADAEDSDD